MSYGVELVSKLWFVSLLKLKKKKLYDEWFKIKGDNWQYTTLLENFENYYSW